MAQQPSYDGAGVEADDGAVVIGCTDNHIDKQLDDYYRHFICHHY